MSNVIEDKVDLGTKKGFLLITAPSHLSALIRLRGCIRKEATYDEI